MGNETAGSARDILPMTVKNMTLLVDRLGEDCSPLQFIRELTQNSIDAARESRECVVVWDVDWAYYRMTGVRKLACIDTGQGMTGEEMVRFINELSSSIHQQSASGNFGVGAKIAAAPRNPHGMVYKSWRNGVGHMIHLWFDPDRHVYGLKRWPSNHGEFWTPVNDKAKPKEIDQHGTMVTLLGRSDEDETIEPPPATPVKSRWVLRYLNTRYYRFPEGVQLKSREGFDLPEATGTTSCGASRAKAPGWSDTRRSMAQCPRRVSSWNRSPGRRLSRRAVFTTPRELRGPRRQTLTTRPKGPPRFGRAERRSDTVCFNSMQARLPIPTSFAAGSGWYRPSGQWAPGSLHDAEARALAAWPCTVVVLYRQGERIPAAELMTRDHLSGSLLCMDRYTHPHWHACLLSEPSVESDMLPRLLHAQLERENDGVRLYGGIEVADRGLEEWRQAWLCAGETRVRKILQEMVERESRSM